MNDLQESHVSERAWFIPGRPGAPGSLLVRYRPIQSVQAVGAYVQRLTQPGDLVVDLFCQGPTVVRETVAAGRRALGFSVNPLLLAITHLGVGCPDADALNAAFTRLADSLKGDVPLRRHLTSLYRSACPVCDAPGVAEWFAWDRDGNYPFEKAVRCSNCGEVREGAADDGDVESARGFQPRGLAYYYALDRVAPLGHPGRERAAQLVELYTPRNLSALMDLTMRLEGLDAGEEAILALTGVLLDCFDAASNLDPYDEDRPRPRTLRVPSRYIERNVWLCFEERLSHLLAEESLLPVRQAADIGALVRGETEGYALVSHAARDVRKTIPAGSTALIFADPPQPDGVFWALSALWAGWLWETPPAHALRPFLRRRRFDWDWHWHALQVALKAAGSLLVPTGHLVTIFSGPDEALLESVCLAACGAGYALKGWGYSPGAGYRLVWRWKPQDAGGGRQEAAGDVEMLERELGAVAKEAVVSTLRERGEPTGWALLHSSAYVRLAERGLLARAAAIPGDSDGSQTSPNVSPFTADAVRCILEAAPIVRLVDQSGAEETLWWLADAGCAAEPLADRVSALMWELLAQRPAWGMEELVDTVYARFPGPLTPDLALVLVCVDSYSVQEGETLYLRSEDDPLRRAAELGALRDDLVELGARLGFETSRRGGWDVRWLEEEREVYVFDVSATVALGRHLLTERTTDEGAQRCLVVPGGRAALVGFKLQRDPRLARAVEKDGWQFIKFRHLRRLLTKGDLDRHALKTVLGLDPIVEQEAAQIPLF
ncbi:MAG: hypothetical protein V3S14_15570 [Anaerolineae bacterium]